MSSFRIKIEVKVGNYVYVPHQKTTIDEAKRRKLRCVVRLGGPYIFGASSVVSGYPRQDFLFHELV